MGQAVTVPDTLQVLVGEILPLSWDFKNQLSPGETISSPTVTVLNSITNESVSAAVASSPSVSNGTVVSVTITTVPLRPRTKYTCAITATPSNGGVTSVIMIISVIF